MLAVLGFYAEASGQEKIQYAPRLVVNITIDQLRTDYLDAFSPLYGQEGLKKLLKEGHGQSLCHNVSDNRCIAILSRDKR